MKFVITEKSSGPAVNCQQTFTNQEERKSIQNHKETWAAPSTKETSARLVIFATRVSLFTKRTIPTDEKSGQMIHAHSRYGGDLAVSVSKMVRTMLRHYDQDERQRDGSRHWDSIKPVWMKAFAHEGARDFDGYWLHLRNGSNIAKINSGILVISRLFRTLWLYSNKSRIDAIHTYSVRLERVPSSQSKSKGFFQSVLGSE